MKCPHCTEGIHFKESTSTRSFYYDDLKPNNNTESVHYDIAIGFCPLCDEMISLLRIGMDGEFGWEQTDQYVVLYPFSSSRPLNKYIPKKYANDFNEAVSILDLSPKASAAISRRLLQHILRDELKIKATSLSKEIDIFISKGDIPTPLKEEVDAIRNIGNFAAHPLKDTNTGEIIDVEANEAEWLLDVLENLFDFIFVQPKKLEERKKKLNNKLSKAKKPPMKGSKAT